ncbi:hypothetical protein HDV02_003730 [Globomyces sp. JEL0801]|nr:hypothetical protein HDV02_003730 [Globomyces sp. JEL0801]
MSQANLLVDYMDWNAFQGEPPAKVDTRPTDYERECIPRAIYNDYIAELQLREEGFSGVFGSKLKEIPQSQNMFEVDEIKSLQFLTRSKSLETPEEKYRNEAKVGELQSLDELNTDEDTRTVVFTDWGIDILNYQIKTAIKPLDKPKLHSPLEKPVHLVDSRRTQEIYPRTNRYASWLNKQAVTDPEVTDQSIRNCEDMIFAKNELSRKSILKYRRSFVPKEQTTRNRGMSFLGRGILDVRMGWANVTQVESTNIGDIAENALIEAMGTETISFVNELAQTQLDAKIELYRKISAKKINKLRSNSQSEAPHSLSVDGEILREVSSPLTERRSVKITGSESSQVEYTRNSVHQTRFQSISESLIEEKKQSAIVGDERSLKTRNSVSHKPRISSVDAKTEKLSESNPSMDDIRQSVSQKYSDSQDSSNFKRQSVAHKSQSLPVEPSIQSKISKDGSEKEESIKKTRHSVSYKMKQPAVEVRQAEVVPQESAISIMSPQKTDIELQEEQQWLDEQKKSLFGNWRQESIITDFALANHPEVNTTNSSSILEVSQPVNKPSEFSSRLDRMFQKQLLNETPNENDKSTTASPKKDTLVVEVNSNEQSPIHDVSPLLNKAIEMRNEIDIDIEIKGGLDNSANIDVKRLEKDPVVTSIQIPPIETNSSKVLPEQIMSDMHSSQPREAIDDRPIKSAKSPKSDVFEHTLQKDDVYLLDSHKGSAKDQQVNDPSKEKVETQVKNKKEEKKGEKEHKDHKDKHKSALGKMKNWLNKSKENLSESAAKSKEDSSFQNEQKEHQKTKIVETDNHHVNENYRTPIETSIAVKPGIAIAEGIPTKEIETQSLSIESNSKNNIGGLPADVTASIGKSLESVGKNEIHLLPSSASETLKNSTSIKENKSPQEESVSKNMQSNDLQIAAVKDINVDEIKSESVISPVKLSSSKVEESVTQPIVINKIEIQKETGLDSLQQHNLIDQNSKAMAIKNDALTKLDRQVGGIGNASSSNEPLSKVTDDKLTVATQINSHPATFSDKPVTQIQNKEPDSIDRTVPGKLPTPVSKNEVLVKEAVERFSQKPAVKELVDIPTVPETEMQHDGRISTNVVDDNTGEKKKGAFGKVKKWAAKFGGEGSKSKENLNDAESVENIAEIDAPKKKKGFMSSITNLSKSKASLADEALTGEEGEDMKKSGSRDSITKKGLFKSHSKVFPANVVPSTSEPLTIMNANVTTQQQVDAAPAKVKAGPKSAKYMNAMDMQTLKDQNPGNDNNAKNSIPAAVNSDKVTEVTQKNEAIEIGEKPNTLESAEKQAPMSRSNLDFKASVSTNNLSQDNLKADNVPSKAKSVGNLIDANDVEKWVN